MFAQQVDDWPVDDHFVAAWPAWVVFGVIFGGFVIALAVARWRDR